MRTKAVNEDSLNAILRLLTAENRAVCLVSLSTGLRVSDVLNIKTADLYKTRFVITEAKTGKRRTIRLSEPIKRLVKKCAGRVYAFPNRLDDNKPRTRQAVWKDLHRVARLLKLKGLAPHSMRKCYAKGLRAAGFTETQIQKALNHSSPIITQIYTMADELQLR